MTTGERNRWWLLVAIVLGAAWWFTRALPPWGDETHFLHTIRIFGQGLSVDLLRTYPEMSGPLPFVLFAWWGHLIGFGTAGLRVLSALIAFATLVMYDSSLEQYGLHGRLKYLLLVLFAANPYFAGLSVFVFTDMLALFGMAVVMHATSVGRHRRAVLGLAVATLARQYLAFVAAALVLAALCGRHERGRERLAWSGAAVAGMLPLAALVWLWGGLSPANDLRHLYVADGLRFDPGALSLYLALPGIYLAPLVVAVLATVPIRRLHLLIACAAAGFVLLFPITPSLPQLREGIHTVGFVHRASVALLPAGAVQWPFAIGAFMGWAAISAAVLKGRHHVGSISIARWLPLAAIVAFLVVMPFSYMPWEKYGLPLLMAVIPLLGTSLVEQRAPAETTDSPRRTAAGAVPARLIGSSFAVFLVAFAVRLVLVWWLQLYAEPFRAEIQSTAASLATQGVFGNEYAVATGPTAHVSPLHTLLLAAAFRVFGTGTWGELASLVINAALAAALYAALPAVGRRLGFPTAVGVAAAWFGALVPFHYLNELRSGDSQVSALVLMGIVVMAIEDMRQRTSNWRHVVARGLVWGIAVLVLPTLLGVIVALLLAQLLRSSPSVAWRPLLASAIIALAAVSPWAIRNAIVLGEAIWTRSNLGIELRIAFNDAAWPDIDRNRTGGAWDLYHPSASVPAAEQLRTEGEVAYNRRLLNDAAVWVQQHPTRAATLVAQRTVFFWVPFTQRPLQRLFLSGLSVCSLVGLYLSFRQGGAQRLGAYSLLVVWLVFPLIYYVTQSAVRYRYPMVWTLLLTSAFAVHHILQSSVRKGRVKDPDR